MSNPWLIDESEFPRDGNPDEKLQFLIRYAVLAPSSHNAQPWRFEVSDGFVDLYGESARSLPIADPWHREMILSCGAALFNLEVAMHHFGCCPNVTLFPNGRKPLLLARIAIGEPECPRCGDEILFHSITHRHTNRGNFEAVEVPSTVLGAIEHAARMEHARFYPADHSDLREVIADAIAEADRIHAEDPQYRKELARWIRPNFSSKSDGIPGSSLGLSTLSSAFAPSFIERFKAESMRAEPDRRLALCAPVLGLLCTDEDTPKAWLSAGMALGRMLLTAYAADVHASFFSEPIEVDSLRRTIANAIPERLFPQLIVRMGYALNEVEPTPRHGADEVTVAP